MRQVIVKMNKEGGIVMNQNIIDQVMKMRELCKTSDDRRDLGLPTNIPEVKRIDNLSYGPDSKWNLLDLYLPKNYPGNVPTIIHVHGGGWCYGTKKTYQFYGLQMAKMGLAFVNFNYPLAPDVHFPTQLDCVDQVFHWVEDHAAEYHLDTNNVFISGDSAGAQMAAQYLTCLFNAEYREKFGYSLPALTVRAATLNCGVYFLNLPDKIRDTSLAYFTPEIIKTNQDRLAFEKYMTKDLPPIFLMTANQDFLHDSSVRLDGYLMAKGIQHELHIYGDEKHPERHVFHINQKDPLAVKCNEDEVKFLKGYVER